MSEQIHPTRSTLLQLTAKIVSAHVGRNKVETDGLSNLINDVYAALRNLDGSGAAPVKAAAPGKTRRAKG